MFISRFRRYQDFYLLEKKLIQFHGVFSDARLPPKRTTTTARNLEFLESIKKDFEHFLRVYFNEFHNKRIIVYFLILASIIETIIT